jgi:hypothetical protein
LKKLDNDSNKWTINDWADFWRYIIGVNVIPADTQYRQVYPRWSEWKDKPVSEEQHEKWKKKNAFEQGIALFPGKVWHRDDKKNLYFVCIDLDNKKAIDEICSIFGVKNIEELAKIVIVEQHKDDLTRAHIYLYSTHEFSKKSSDQQKYKTEIKSDQIPAIEVKGLGKHGISFCSNSKHKNGCCYGIDHLKEPLIFGKEIEDKLFDIYKKYNLQVGNNGKIPIKELLKEDFVVSEGHNRSEALLRVMESWLVKYRAKLSKDEIKQKAWNYNLKHFRPPLDQKKFENQWKDAQKFIDQKTDYSTEAFDNIGYLITKVIDHGFNPKAYYIDIKSEEVRYGIQTVNGLFPKKSIFDIYPKKVIIYNNPLFNRISLISVEFSNGLKLGPLNNISDIVKELESKGHVLNKLKASDALNSIISALKDKGLVEIVDDVTTSGFYLINNKIVRKNTTQNQDIKREHVIACCNYLNELAEQGWMDKGIFPTVLKWGMISPFSFALKYNSVSKNWMPWLQLYGHGQTGKTTLGEIVFDIWNQNPRDHSIGFNHIDSVARFGNVLSRDTYPKLVNEIGALSHNSSGKYIHIIEMIKHSVESTTVRGKYMNNNNSNSYQHILALSPMMFTSNHQPINDSGYKRRMLSIHFADIEKKDEQQQLSFKKLYEANKIFLKTLGDFTAWYLEQDPDKLLQIPWNELAKEILGEFYKLGGLITPPWIDYFVEQRDAVDESNEKTFFGLRSIVLNKINVACSQYSRVYGNEEFARIGISIDKKLRFCLDNNLIPYLHKIDGYNIAITVDIMNDIKHHSLENITSLKDIGSIVGVKYVNKKFNGKRMRLLEGSIGNLTTFLESDIE